MTVILDILPTGGTTKDYQAILINKDEDKYNENRLEISTK